MRNGQALSLHMAPMSNTSCTKVWVAHHLAGALCRDALGSLDYDFFDGLKPLGNLDCHSLMGHVSGVRWTTIFCLKNAGVHDA